MFFIPYIFWWFRFYATNVHFYFLLFNTYISLKMVQLISNLIWGSSTGISVLNYTSPSAKEHVLLYPLKCCLCCLVFTIYQVYVSLRMVGAVPFTAIASNEILPACTYMYILYISVPCKITSYARSMARTCLIVNLCFRKTCPFSVHWSFLLYMWM
jgi:hypothetical protein